MVIGVYQYARMAAETSGTLNRSEQILQELLRHGEVSVDGLAKAFGVSAATIRRDLSEERALEAVSALRRATIAPVDEPLALEAADLSLAHGLAMADSLVYATARRYGAMLVTGDADFEGLPGAVVVR